MYLTFLASFDGSWRLHRGIGVGPEVIAEHRVGVRISDVGAATTPILWTCGDANEDGQPVLRRLVLPDLVDEEVGWGSGRIGAIACSPSGNQAVALAQPASPADEVGLQLYEGSRWTRLSIDPAPDISSRLAWLGQHRIAYESEDRRLTVYDLGSGTADVGPPGRCPVAASDIGRWYAIEDGSVVELDEVDPFRRPVEPVQDFEFGRVADFRMTRDGQVCLWREPGLGHRQKAYVQRRGAKRARLREAERTFATVVGPYELPERTGALS